jgi:hypothetical protein
MSQYGKGSIVKKKETMSQRAKMSRYGRRGSIKQMGDI